METLDWVLGCLLLIGGYRLQYRCTDFFGLDLDLHLTEGKHDKFWISGKHIQLSWESVYGVGLSLQFFLCIFHWLQINVNLLFPIVIQVTQQKPASVLASSMLHRMINPVRAYRYICPPCLKFYNPQTHYFWWLGLPCDSRRFLLLVFIVVVTKVGLRCGGGVCTAQKEQGVMLLVSIWELQTHA